MFPKIAIDFSFVLNQTMRLIPEQTSCVETINVPILIFSTKFRNSKHNTKESDRLTFSFHYANIVDSFQFENKMHLISAGKVKQAASKFPDASKPIQVFCKIIKQANWQNLLEVQKVYRDAEAVGSFTVFNIKGNKYRLIIDLDYAEQVAYFKYFLTHAEYDREKWKNDPYFE